MFGTEFHHLMIKAHQKGAISGPVDECRIAQYERDLKFPFPKQYRAFLTKYGAANFIGYSISGIGSELPTGETPYWSDVLQDTKYLRECLSKQTGSEVAISTNGYGGVFYIVNTGPADTRVRLVDHGNVSEIAETFEQFVLEAPTRDLDNWGYIPDH